MAQSTKNIDQYENFNPNWLNKGLWDVQAKNIWLSILKS